MKWNCDPRECDAPFGQLILSTCDCIPSFKTFTVPAATVIEYGAPVKAGAAAGEVVPALAADGAAVIGFAYGQADTRPAPDGNPACNEICVLIRDAQIKADGIAYPAGTTAAQAAAILAHADSALRIVARQTI
ncbi:MAG: hypothetical protein ACOYB0_08165 [Polynucleobacter sp.]